jgi:hypothetical protein
VGFLGNRAAAASPQTWPRQIGRAAPKRHAIGSVAAGRIRLPPWRVAVRAFSSCPGLDPGWMPVRVKKTHQNKNLELRF